tara:strand:- start:338 stop:556 length:219 start_codon:yes stop_codon:yes gene_type:complete
MTKDIVYSQDQALIDTAKSYGIDNVIPNNYQLKQWTINRIVSGDKTIINHLKLVQEAKKPISVSINIKLGGK